MKENISFRPRHNWDDNKMDFRELGLKDVDWIYLD
jgi:hypothetical protein